MSTSGEHWRIDIAPDGEFWVVSDASVTDNWRIEMTCTDTKKTKTSPPVQGFVNFMGVSRRNAWPMTPFGWYGFITARTDMGTGGAEHHVLFTGKPVL